MIEHHNMQSTANCLISFNKIFFFLATSLRCTTFVIIQDGLWICLQSIHHHIKLATADMIWLSVVASFVVGSVHCGGKLTGYPLDLLVCLFTIISLVPSFNQNFELIFNYWCWVWYALYLSSLKITCLFCVTDLMVVWHRLTTFLLNAFFNHLIASASSWPILKTGFLSLVMLVEMLLLQYTQW